MERTRFVWVTRCTVMPEARHQGKRLRFGLWFRIDGQVRPDTDHSGRLSMSIPYTVQSYRYYFARGDHRAVPANAHVYIRRVSPPLDVIFQVHLQSPGHGTVTHQLWPGGAWQPTHGLLQVQSGFTYRVLWVPGTRPTPLTAEQVRTALSFATAQYKHEVTPEDGQARRLFAARYEVPTAPGHSTAVNIDWALIRRLEGFHPEGEVPGERSGVTVSAGFDLHEKTVADLVALGVPSEVAARLRPFLAQADHRPGPVGQAARAALALWRTANPGQRELISRQICEQVFERTGVIRARAVASRYNSVSNVPFASIPAAAQTVIVSVLYQYGTYAEVPWMWEPAIRQNWNGLVQGLRHQAEQHFAGRRRQEADYLALALGQTVVNRQANASRSAGQRHTHAR